MGNLLTPTDIILRKDPTYILIGAAWVMAGGIILGSSVIIKYLRSKPLLSQTVMDYANTAFFVSVIPSSISLAVIITSTVLFEDCGKIIGSVLGYVAPAILDQVHIQLLGNFVVQALMIKKPSLIENETFENVVKLILSIIIPLGLVGVYTYGYWQGFITALYRVVRGVNALPTQEFSIWLYLKAILNLLMALMFLISGIQLWISRYDETGGHVLFNKVTLITITVQIVISIPLSVAIIKTGIFSNLLSLLVLTMHVTFVITIMVSHDGIRNYIVHRLPSLTYLRQVCAVRQARRVNNDQHHFEMRGLS